MGEIYFEWTIPLTSPVISCVSVLRWSFFIQSLILLLSNFPLLSKITVQESASHMFPHWFHLVAIRTQNLCDDMDYLITFFTFKFFAVSRHGSFHFGSSYRCVQLDSRCNTNGLSGRVVVPGTLYSVLLLRESKHEQHKYQQQMKATFSQNSSPLLSVSCLMCCSACFLLQRVALFGSAGSCLSPSLSFLETNLSICPSPPGISCGCIAVWLRMTDSESELSIRGRRQWSNPRKAFPLSLLITFFCWLRERERRMRWRRGGEETWSNCSRRNYVSLNKWLPAQCTFLWEVALLCLHLASFIC